MVDYKNRDRMKVRGQTAVNGTGNIKDKVKEME
jgi:hypothetical protein